MDKKNLFRGVIPEHWDAIPEQVYPVPIQLNLRRIQRSSTDFIPDKDAQLPPYLNNLVTYANANLAALTLVAGDITPISTGATAYGTALNNVATAKEALKQAILTKDAARKTVTTNVRVLSRKVQGIAVVTPAQKAALGLSPRTGQRQRTAPLTPAGLIATASADGTNTLSWNRNTNKLSTVFVVKTSYVGGSGWVYVDAITSTRYQHTGQTPGVSVYYRVTATRNKQSSEPSQSAIVYGPPRRIVTDLKIAA